MTEGGPNGIAAADKVVLVGVTDESEVTLTEVLKSLGQGFSGEATEVASSELVALVVVQRVEGVTGGAPYGIDAAVALALLEAGVVGGGYIQETTTPLIVAVIYVPT